jgi:hypothetical protein
MARKIPPIRPRQRLIRNMQGPIPLRAATPTTSGTIRPSTHLLTLHMHLPRNRNPIPDLIPPGTARPSPTNQNLLLTPPPAPRLRNHRQTRPVPPLPPHPQLRTHHPAHSAPSIRSLQPRPATQLVALPPPPPRRALVIARPARVAEQPRQPDLACPAPDQRLHDRQVRDDDRYEGFAACPFAAGDGAVGAGLYVTKKS